MEQLTFSTFLKLKKNYDIKSLQYTEIVTGETLVQNKIFPSIKQGFPHTVDGQKVANAHRRLICQRISVSRNLSQKVIPSVKDFSCLYSTFTSEVVTFR